MIRIRQSHIAFKVLKHPFVVTPQRLVALNNRRNYIIPPHERNKFGNNDDRQVIIDGIQNSMLENNGRKLRFRTVVGLVVGSFVTTLSLYVAVQVWQLQNEEISHNGENSKRIFLPLWLNLNWIYTTKYEFPNDLQYLDKSYFEYWNSELSQFKTNDKLLIDLQNENIKYKILTIMSSNRTIRKLLRFPLTLETLEDNSDRFQIWIETKCPTISGIEIDLKKSNDNSSLFKKLNWCIKPLNFKSIIEGALVQVGLKLDRLERSAANNKTHERASGKVHEVPITEPMTHHLVLNSRKDYDVVFEGEVLLADNEKINDLSSRGRLLYKGTIDFDHLLINRGVKILELSLLLPDQGNEKGYMVYKLL
ncbi:hypothetical protein CAAN4_H12992 [[Candida] anglica]|uniref:Uncharacterized protein n=1 Tax=[Candida] anglica TaxID=148631 RepID=A0ABP0EKL2_9ASCO